ncbi:hypothetical protein [Nonlabens sp. Hel1_33_55]|nr:hypothetical protein [Nonlabens sp. Hel1_33_55]
MKLKQKAIYSDGFFIALNLTDPSFLNVNRFGDYYAFAKANY